MKLFIDSGDIEEIKKVDYIVDGCTTNPSLIAKTGKPFLDVITEICTIMGYRPVSVEVVSEDEEGMIEEAKELVKIAKNIVVKIPITLEGMKAVKALDGKVKTNVTLVFSANQALLAANARANYVSIFIGRLDDIGHEGMQVVRDTVEALFPYATEVIVASVRHPLHVIDAAKAGADIATVPYNILEKMVSHPLTDIGIKRFKEDWAKCKK